MASSSGTTILIVLGLVAVGFASSGDDAGDGTTTQSASSSEFSYSYEPDPSVENDSLFDEPSGEDDDFSFEPEDGSSGSSDDGDDGGGGDDGDDGGDEGGDGGAECDEVVVVDEGSEQVDVPGESTVVQESSVDCTMSSGADGDAVATLQDALATCNGQDVTVDGEYGEQTRQAVAAVEAQNGLTADGAYDPATAQAMSWPSGDGCTGG